jgi:hypothetical protein
MHSGATFVGRLGLLETLKRCFPKISESLDLDNIASTERSKSYGGKTEGKLFKSLLNLFYGLDQSEIVRDWRSPRFQYPTNQAMRFDIGMESQRILFEYQVLFILPYIFTTLLIRGNSIITLLFPLHRRGLKKRGMI